MPNSEVHSGVAVARFQDFPIFPREQFGHRPATIRIVLDNQYTRHERRAIALLFEANAKRRGRVPNPRPVEAVLTVSRSDSVARCRIGRHLNRDWRMARDKTLDHRVKGSAT